MNRVTFAAKFDTISPNGILPQTHNSTNISKLLCWVSLKPSSGLLLHALIFNPNLSKVVWTRLQRAKLLYVEGRSRCVAALRALKSLIRNVVTCWVRSQRTLWVKNPKALNNYKGGWNQQSHRVVTYSTGKCGLLKKCQGALTLQNKVSSLKAQPRVQDWINQGSLLGLSVHIKDIPPKASSTHHYQYNVVVKKTH